VRTNNRGSKRSVVLLSGGLDSTVALALAAQSGPWPVAALFFDYGQHAAAREDHAARRIAGRYGLSYERIELPWLAKLSSSALVAGKGEPPVWAERLLDDRAARAVWVENRNGIFVDIAACYASETGSDTVIVGFNREEASAFPDNSEEYLARMNRALELGCRRRVRIESPTLAMGKRDIVERALDLAIPWELLWSCYRGGERMCGSCESCLRLARAIAGTAAAPLVRFGGKKGSR
jgi:7-cyano-7-deazaguanine synthase